VIPILCVLRALGGLTQLPQLGVGKRIFEDFFGLKSLRIGRGGFENVM